MNAVDGDLGYLPYPYQHEWDTVPRMVQLWLFRFIVYNDRQVLVTGNSAVLHPLS
ncbi:hypothetical protein J6590_022472 [Homalodisca vitripennis]|nr:hypothetical protein J6590_022472 [Homalodisca vitripennis]